MERGSFELRLVVMQMFGDVITTLVASDSSAGVRLVRHGSRRKTPKRYCARINYVTERLSNTSFYPGVITLLG
jgi:hypothetical protein